MCWRWKDFMVTIYVCRFILEKKKNYHWVSSSFSSISIFSLYFFQAELGRWRTLRYTDSGVRRWMRFLRFKRDFPLPMNLLRCFLVTHIFPDHLFLKPSYGSGTHIPGFTINVGPLCIMKFCFPAWVWEPHDYKCSSHCLPSSPA